MIKIIGHRGAAGLAQENTAAGFEMVKKLGVDAVEFDVQQTRDGQFVVLHDNHLGRVSNSKARVSDLTYAEISQVSLNDGGTLPLLKDVLASLRDVPVILDIKIRRNLTELIAVLNEFPDMDISLASKWQSNIPEFKRLRPGLRAYAGQRFYMPVGTVRHVRGLRADGIMVYWLWMNPLTYRAARKHGLEVGVFTIDNPLLGRIFSRLYPDIWICTNRPDTFIKSMRDTST